jgi:hypothetical protein
MFLVTHSDIVIQPDQEHIEFKPSFVALSQFPRFVLIARPFVDKLSGDRAILEC